jgi:hypothetical protein
VQEAAVTILVDWPGYVAGTAGLAVLLGETLLLRSARAAVRMCGAVGVANLADWLITGNVIGLVAGAIILTLVCWCLRSLRRDAGRR